MHKIAFAILAVGAMAVSGVNLALAQRAGAYAWCAGPIGDSNSNCGFTSYRQCMASAQGMNIICSRNQNYRGGRHRR